MTLEAFNALPEPQRKAFQELQKRSGIPFLELLERSYAPTPLTPYISVTNFWGMFVGIEPDGFTHS